MDVAFHFEIENLQAKTIAKEVALAVSSWRIEASKLKIKKGEIDRMASSFDHEDFEKAMRLN